MKDTVIFMSAYDTTKYVKSNFLHFEKKMESSKLLDKYHFTYILMGDKLISSQGTLELDSKYDYVQQKTIFEFKPTNEKDNIEKFEKVIDKTSFCVSLLHAQSVLTDSTYFNIDYVICMEQFLVNINKQLFQIDPVIFSLNRIIIIAFEVIEYETGIPLNRNKVFGHQGNYNLQTVEYYQYFGDENIIPFNGKISEIIYNNVSDFFFEETKKKYKAEGYSFIHGTLVLSNEIDDIKEYFCKLLGVRELPSPFENISTTENYEYYPQDGASVIKDYNPDEIEIPLFNGILLESMKLYIYLFQIVNAEITESLSMVMRNDMYLENLFYAPHVAIETHNLLSYVYQSKSFQHHKEAIKLKITYLSAENETKKNRYSVLLNILLYIISLLGAISALETLQNQLGIPFKYSFTCVIIIFLLFGIIWTVVELRRSKR